MPFIPILMSRMAAPFSSCAIAISRTRSSFPSRSWACSFFFPVGLIRSPTTRKLPSRPTSTFLRSDARILRCDANGSSIPRVASESALICFSVVPQHPPTMAAPAFTSATPAPANSSGVMRYTVFFPSSSGSPAFGFAMSGIVAYSAIFSTRGTISIGPAEQFTPIASTPRDCSTTTAVSGGVPNNVRPSSL